VAGGLLKDRLQAYMRTRADKTIYLKADRSLPYGTVVETMDLLNRMGIENLGMLTESREKPTESREKK
jgi:biopolymer transport protein ExbD